LAVKEVWSVERDGLRFAAYDFVSQPHVVLRLYLMRRAGNEPSHLVVLNVLDEQSWPEFLAAARVGFEQELKDETLPEPDQEAYEAERQMHENFKWAMAYVAPRGIGPTAWDQSDKKQTQHRRRFALLGQTLDGMRVWDVRRAIQALRALDGFEKTPLWLQSHRRMAGVTLYASLFEPEITRLDLHELPKSHREGPFLLNVSKSLDMPQAAALAAERSRVVIYQDGNDGWEYTAATASHLGWDKKQFGIRPLVQPTEADSEPQEQRTTE
jgi:hypothetical protein